MAFHNNFHVVSRNFRVNFQIYFSSLTRNRIYRAYLSEDFSVYSNDCSLGNRKKRVLGHWRLFLLSLRRNCPAAGLLAVKSCEKCHESEATAIRLFSREKAGRPRRSVPDPKKKKNPTSRSEEAAIIRLGRNRRNVVRALNEKCVRHSCWGLRSRRGALSRTNRPS